ncbi:hypothetical protein RN001_012335 [Aquatica leii]|uniref:Elongation of very long chain fatty acids protein n=1 Tax=Aquatica leii TaxID=1421715 RepID=A0AAN7QES4_9COLE|nr:hypothetical protein RN001_012335 [Aquatica leii]
MADLMHMVVENYNEVLEHQKDPIVDTWMFMKSPVPVVAILIFYLYFVLKLGPQLMEKRKAFNLTYVLIAYNAYQVIFSSWLCAQVLREGSAFDIIFQHCNAAITNTHIRTALANGAWWYFFSKVVELLDTVFFVLRKKQSQVTFLHVYHHTNTMFFSWVYLKFLPGSQGIIIGFLNSAVHVVMYFYYLISSLGPKYQKYLWWKKYMTWIQLTQFCLMLLYLITVFAMDCKMPKALTFFFAGNVIIFLYLFADFYKKAYKKRKSITLEKEEFVKTQ